MKKALLVAMVLVVAGSTLLIGATSVGSEIEYYSDASRTTQVGYRSYGDCRYAWGKTTSYRMLYPCNNP